MSFSIIISVGKWGGIYWYWGVFKRLCLGWVALTLFTPEWDCVMNRLMEKAGYPLKNKD